MAPKKAKAKAKKEGTAEARSALCCEGSFQSVCVDFRVFTAFWVFYEPKKPKAKAENEAAAEARSILCCLIVFREF